MSRSCWPRCWRRSPRATAAATSTAPSAAAAMPAPSSRPPAAPSTPIDRDPDAIARGAALAARFPAGCTWSRAASATCCRSWPRRGRPLDGVVLDLGVSSFQIDEAERGFSLRADGPLDMRMEKSGPTAAELVNTLPERSWPTCSGSSARSATPAASPGRSSPPAATRRSRRRPALAAIHGAAARPLRHGQRDALLPGAAAPGERRAGRGGARPGRRAALLAPGGRLVVVAFHSLEDRLVKRFMRDAAGRSAGASRHDPARWPCVPDGGLSPSDGAGSAALRGRDQCKSTRAVGTAARYRPSTLHA